MSCATLPAEIQDLVIDQVAPDARSLRHCALVCRTWRPRSTLHLFSTITVKSDSAFRVLSALVEARCGWLAHTLTLRLHMPGIYDSAHVAKVLSGLPQLQELSMAVWDAVAAALTTSASSLPGLRALRIDAPSISTCKATFSLMESQLYRLQLLDVSSVKNEAIPAVGRMLSHVGPSLSVLRIGILGYLEGVTDGALREHFSLAHFPRLRSLSIANLSFHPGHLCSTSYAWVPQIVRQCSADEVTLELGFPPVMGGGAFGPRVSRRVSEHILDWMPWSNFAEALSEGTRVVLDIWPKGAVKEDAIVNAVKCRLPSDVRRQLRTTV